MTAPTPTVTLARHGETEWSISGQHTGRTDIPLTTGGEAASRRLGDRLRGETFALVLTSPLIRARRTCELAGFGDVCVNDPDLLEWDYGDFEGKTSAQIRAEAPDWDLFRDGCPGGESVGAISARVDRLITRLRRVDGNALVFSHGHLLRVLAARWLGLPAADARLFVLNTASVSTLGYEKSIRNPAVRLWNDDRHVTG